MKYATFDADGFLVAFYDDEINVIPEGAVRITDEQWRDLLNHQGFRRWDGADVVAYDPPTPAEPFPSVVTSAQAKIALYSAGLLDQVKAVVAAHPYEVVRLWYDNAGTWERGNPYVQALGVEIGLTDEQIDDLFIAANKI